MSRIKKLREAKGISQTWFATQVGVSQQAVAGWESGGSDPAWDKAPKIADVLGCNINEVFIRELPHSDDTAEAS